MAKNGPWVFNISVCADTDEDIVYQNMPDVDSFLFNSSRHITFSDLSGMNEVRFLVNKQSVPGVTGSKLTLKYSTEYSLNPSDYSDIGTEPVQLSIDVENTFLKTDWIWINTEVPRGDVYLAIIGSGGDNIISPHFGHISINFA